MTQCLIHFGMHKTGTTAIQRHLYRSCVDRRFHFIDLGNANASVRIATAFLKEPQRFHVHRKLGSTRQAIERERGRVAEELAEQIRMARGRTAILSAEVISVLAESEFADLCDVLTRAGATRIKAVGYVRAPRSYLDSAFQQSVKGGRRSIRLEAVFPKYRERFSKFDAVLGRDQVAFWSFTPATFPEKCVVQDFARRNGIDLGDQKPLRINEALSLYAMQLLFIYRKLGPGFGVGRQAVEENRRLVDHLAQLKGPPLRFHADYVAPLLLSHRDDIAWMEERMGAPLEEQRNEGDAGIHSESDLLDVSDIALKWLAGEIRMPEPRDRLSLREIAEGVHRLRQKLAGQAQSNREQRQTRAVPGARRPAWETDTRRLNARRLVVLANGGSEGKSGVPQARRLIASAFNCVRHLLLNANEGTVCVEGMGTFRIGAVRNTDATGARRVTFRPQPNAVSGKGPGG